MIFIHPVDNFKTIVSGYGLRKDPFTGQIKFHKGIDYKIPMGTEVKASQDGKVIFSNENNSGYGKHIIIEHEENFYTLYAHLKELKPKVNDIVSKGEIIGFSGNSGRSTGAHLHFEIRNNKESLDPAKFLKYTITNETPYLKPLIFGAFILFFLSKK